MPGDKAGVAVQNAPLDAWVFNYIVTVDGKTIAVGQEAKDRAYLHFATNVTFTDEDNRVMEKSQGGIAGVVKTLRIVLASQRISYSGIEEPLRSVSIKKQIFMGGHFSEYELMQAVLEVESAIILTQEISTIPHHQQAKQISQ